MAGILVGGLLLGSLRSDSKGCLAVGLQRKRKKERKRERTKERERDLYIKAKFLVLVEELVGIGNTAGKKSSWKAKSNKSRDSVKSASPEHHFAQPCLPS